MSDQSDRPHFGSRLLGAALLAALAYPVSLGPACWALSWLRLEMRHPAIADAVSTAYGPLAPAAVSGPEPVRGALRWWIGVGMPPGTAFHGDWPRGIGWSNPGYTYTLWHY